MLSLSEEDIRQRATPQSWARGLKYFRQGHVVRALWRGDVFTAWVQGSEYEPYRVTVTFTPEGAVASAHCTCPYDWGGDCKHIVAALLYLVHHGEEIERRPPLQDLLEGLSREQLVQILLELARNFPDEVTELVEEAAQAAQARPSPEAEPESVPASELTHLRSRIKRDLRAMAQNFYGAYYEGWDFEEEVSEVLRPALDWVDELLESGRLREALTVLEAATEAWIEACDDLGYVFRDAISDFVADEPNMEHLGQQWATALLMADLSPEARKAWAEKLKAWSKTMPGGEALKIAVTAAEQGWDYPPLVAAMQGHITEQGVWAGEAPHFADALARIRLEILERRGRVQEYLNLAQAEGQYHLYVRKLVHLGRYDLALQEARDMLTRPEDILDVARAFWERGQTEQALALGEHGLGLESRWPGHEAQLAQWVRDRAAEAGRLDLARRAAWKALAASVSVENYRRLARLYGDAWPQYREKALDIVEKQGDAIAVDILLREGEYRRAMRLVERKHWWDSTSLLRVIHAVKEKEPAWAFAQCRRQAEEIMDAGRSSEYDAAVEWLRLGRDILVATGQKERWNAYLAHLLEKHQRKYKLRPMLEELILGEG